MNKKVTDFLQDNNGSWFEENIVSRAPIIVAIFANFVVVVADVRVYDVIFAMTASWWKALSASLACAIPFVMWEIAWQYNHTTDNWRTTSLLMAGLAFATSIVLGVADFIGLTGGNWADIFLASVVILTGIHTVVGFLYYYNDPDVARRRRKAQALAKMADNETNAEVARVLLEQGNSLLKIVSDLERNYSPDEVEAIMNILNGKRGKDKPSAAKPMRHQFASESKTPENPTQGGK